MPIVSGSIKQIRPPYRINSEKRRTDRTKAMELAGYVVRWLCSWLTRAIHVADWLPATCGWPGCLAAYDAIMWLAACLASCLGGCLGGRLDGSGLYVPGWLAIWLPGWFWLCGWVQKPVSCICFATLRWNVVGIE